MSSRMRPPSSLRLVFAFLLCAASIQSAAEQRIKVLWYRYAEPTSRYTSFAYWLAANAHRYELASGLAWDLTFFAPDDPAPDFKSYNVLVIESGEAFRTGPIRSANTDHAKPDYRGILANKAAIQAARGDRTFISATDGDYHALRRDPGTASPRADRWDGARGHFVNAVNWAGSGKGLGLVVWCDCEFPGSAWWQHPDSFLRSELAGRVKYFRDNAPVLTPAAAQLYLNHGLTNQGLAGWQVSFHGGFRLPVPGYTPLIMSSVEPRYAVAIASSETAAAPAGPNPSLQFVLEKINVHENDGSVAIDVVRSANAIGSISVDYRTEDGSANAASDYRSARGTLHFDDGDKSPKSIVLNILRDKFAEGTEHFTLQLSNPTNGAVLGAQASLKVEVVDAGGATVAPKAPAPTASSPASGGCSIGVRGFDVTLSLLLTLAAWRLCRRWISSNTGARIPV